jgi:hypothetical protein
MMKVTKHSTESGHLLSSEDVTVLHKNTLYMDHLMKVTNETQPLPDSFRDVRFSTEMWLPSYFSNYIEQFMVSQIFQLKQILRALKANISINIEKKLHLSSKPLIMEAKAISEKLITPQRHGRSPMKTSLHKLFKSEY